MHLKKDSAELSTLGDLRLQKSLAFSLRHHHRQVLMQLPRDLALQAMNEVWEACQVVETDLWVRSRET